MRTVIAVFVLAISATYAAAADGTLCVAPVPRGNDKPTSLGNPSGGGRTFNFTVRVGKKTVKVRHDGPISFSGLDTSKSHLVVIRRNDKPFAAFKLKFESKKKVACLYFGALYETWTVTEEKLKFFGCGGCG